MTSSLIERLLDLACAIQQIPAPTFHEQARAAFVRDQFSALDLSDVEIDALGNVLGRRPADSAPHGNRVAHGDRPLLITAHLDTVFPADTPLTLKRAHDQIMGPGIGDNSLGVAGLCGLVWAFEGETLPRDLYLAANVSEEGLGDLRGMRGLVERFGQQVNAVIVLEGMALGRIYHSAIAVRRYRFTARAEGGHSWLDFGCPSATHTLVRLGARLADLVVPQSPKTTFNIGTIGGGTSVNTIARQATLDLDLRSESPSVLDALAAHVEELATAFGGHGVQLETQIIGNRPAGGIPRDHPLVQLAARALERAGISSYSFEAGSTDANLPLSRGLPSVCIGLAHGGNSHRPDEYIEIEAVDKGLQSVVGVVRGACTI